MQVQENTYKKCFRSIISNQYNILPQGFFDAAKLTGAFTTYHGNENDLQMLLVEYGPVVTAINAAPLHHYHSGQIEGSLGDSDYLCCDANPDLINKQTTTTNKPLETTTDSNLNFDSNTTTDNYNYYYYDYGYEQPEECR